MTIMQGKTVVITGATSGIGEVAARCLAEQGARLVLVARNPERAEATRAKLSAINPAHQHTAHIADLSSIAEMKRVAGEIAAAEPRIDVLINNAGAIFTKRVLSADGLEMTFASNHLSYFVLTNLLLDRLKAAPHARIVSTASAAHRGQTLDFGDLQSSHYGALRAYGRSKLCNILFTHALAHRLQNTSLTANCLHPGFVHTRFGSNNGGFLGFLRPLIMGFGVSPEEGTKTIVFLASSPDVAGTSGKYFYNCREDMPSAPARDHQAAERLWAESVRITGVGGEIATPSQA